MSVSQKALWKKRSNYIDGSGSYGHYARKAWEEYWGEKRPEGYYVHHVDGDRSNNEISNLALVTIANHYRIHALKREWKRIHGLVTKKIVIIPEHPEGMFEDKFGFRVPSWALK